jgi:hypothetical protein
VTGLKLAAVGPYLYWVPRMPIPGRVRATSAALRSKISGHYLLPPGYYPGRPPYLATPQRRVARHNVSSIPTPIHTSRAPASSSAPRGTGGIDTIMKTGGISVVLQRRGWNKQPASMMGYR